MKTLEMAIENLTDYDLLNWDKYTIDIINRFGSDNKTETINIYGLSIDEIIYKIQSL